MKKKHHFIVVIILIFIGIVNSILPISALIVNKKLFLPDASLDYMLIMIISVLNVHFCERIYVWKEYGFWGLLITANILVILNFVTGIELLGNPWQIVLGIIALYAALQIKRDGVSTWQELE